jgi:hypothetical protein
MMTIYVFIIQIQLSFFTQTMFPSFFNFKKEEKIDISGRWDGTITRDEGGGKRTVFGMEVDIKQKNKDLTGYAIVSFDDGAKKYFAKMDFKGKISGTYIKYVENNIISADSIPGAEWCIKKAELIYKIQGNTPKLEGIWEGWISNNKQPCIPGRIDLMKKPPRA